MYEKVNANRNFVQQEKKIEKFWKDNRIFEKSIEDRKDSPIYMFYDGPPTANFTSSRNLSFVICPVLCRSRR